ncbi:MAG TPA: phage holin family protein [Thermoguttaceae bacterium]|nr:phage holin family protein [Thermoguttaceae bacterium]
MSERNERNARPLLERLGKELNALGGDLRESAALRWQLAVLEIRADLRSGRRLAISLTVAAVMGLTALPLLLVAAAHLLDGYYGLSSTGWLVVGGLVLLCTAPVVALLAWRRFRRRFLGLEQTLEELHEDAAWLREWLGRER